MRIPLIALLICSSLSAATPEKTAKIEHLFDLLKASLIENEIHSQLAVQIDRVAAQVAQQAGFPVAERSSATADLKEKMMTSMKDLTSWQRLKPGMIDIYDQEYTDAQLDGLIAFFGSPLGQTYLAKSAEVTVKAREMAGTHVKDVGDSVQALAKEWLEQHKAPAPPGAGTPQR